VTPARKARGYPVVVMAAFGRVGSHLIDPHRALTVCGLMVPPGIVPLPVMRQGDPPRLTCPACALALTP